MRKLNPINIMYAMKKKLAFGSLDASTLTTCLVVCTGSSIMPPTFDAIPIVGRMTQAGVRVHIVSVLPGFA